MASSERPRESATVDKQVLSCDKDRVCGAKQGASRSELLGPAEALGRVRVSANLQLLLERPAKLLGVELEIRLLPVCQKRPGQQPVDCHVVLHHLPRKNCKKPDQTDSGAVREAQLWERQSD